MNALNAPATVRISGPPNSSFLVGYPGISATLVSFFFLFAFYVILEIEVLVLRALFENQLLRFVYTVACSHPVTASNSRKGRNSTKRRLLSSSKCFHGPDMLAATRNDTSSGGKYGKETSRHTETRDGGSGRERSVIISVCVWKGGRKCHRNGFAVSNIYPIWARRRRSKPAHPASQSSITQSNRRDVL